MLRDYICNHITGNQVVSSPRKVLLANYTFSLNVRKTNWFNVTSRLVATQNRGDIMYRLNRNVVMAVTLSAAITLTACGGGSSGSGGDSGTAESSSIVINNRNLAMVNEPVNLFAWIVKLATNAAWAQMFPVFVDDEIVDETIMGYLVVPVTAGMHWLCVGTAEPQADPPPPNCMAVNVNNDQVVVVDLYVDDNGNITDQTTAVPESTFENVGSFQDPNNSQKTLVCHNRRKMISVGTPAALAGHQGHGDYLVKSGDMCGNQMVPDAQNANGNNNDNKGNNGNGGKGNENRCNKGNKVKKNCEDTNEQV